MDTDGPVFLMVEQAQVRGHTTHRRGGLHVDGRWNPSIWSHGQYPGPGHRHEPCPAPTGLAYGAEAIILASDVLGCAAYTGCWEGSPAQDGCCAHIDTSGLDRVDLEPGLAWVGNTLSMLHESLALPQDCQRTVVRLNVPGWSAPTH